MPASALFYGRNPYVGIDLDNCIDAATHELTAEANSIVAAINGYTERTAVGMAFTLSSREIPPEGRKKGNVEMYEASRYFTVTGDQWPDTDVAVERTAEICDFHERVFGRAKTKKSARSLARLSPVESNPTDEQIVATIRASTNAAKFKPLFRGNWAAPTYPSQSEANLALAASWRRTATVITRRSTVSSANPASTATSGTSDVARRPTASDCQGVEGGLQTR